MNAKSISIIAAALLFTGILVYQLFPSAEPATKTPVVKQSKPEQYVVVLDLSDRITKPGQIEADKQLIEKTFEAFRIKVQSQLCINSRDRFQVIIAPQRGLPFDKDVESQKLTLDMPALMPAEKAKVLKEFGTKLRVKLDSLYALAYHGQESKNYQGSNIWQFFNETLPELTNASTTTKLVVLTDGYFDFEENNAVMNSGGLSTSTNFLGNLRQSKSWKEDIESGRYGILPVKKNFPNLMVSVIGIRSKYENNLLEAEMLKYLWERWCINSDNANNLTLVSHGSITNTSTKLKAFLQSEI